MKILSPTSGSPEPKDLVTSGEAPRESGFEDRRNSTGLGEPETPLLGGADKVMCASGPRGKKAVNSEEMGSDLPALIRGSPVEAGGGCGSLQGQGHWQW